MNHGLRAVAALLPLTAGCAHAEDRTPDHLVAAYYYPWHGAGFHGGQYLRERLTPPQGPLIGEYDDSSPEVIAHQIAWSERAGVDVWAVSWWGAGSREDRTLLQSTLPALASREVRFAIHFETEGLTHGFTRLGAIPHEMRHLAMNYFGHPRCLRIGGRPVLIVYLARAAQAHGMLEPMIASMRAAARESGTDVFLVGDCAFGPPPAEAPWMSCLDAITNYDVYARTGEGVRLWATAEGLDRMFAEQRAWRALAHRHGVAFVPAVTPGFNDRGVREGHLPLSRSLSREAEEGSLFRAMLRGARELTDASAAHLLLITSWNEWHEDTQIEPVAPAPPANRDDSPSGTALTGGLAYPGYGMLYLDMIPEELGR
ncbi:MAG: glycoside hydrolase family 99-like domain-containing protein [Candidatus Sumerlaeia bacterium]|nr:glycoside hydrolase family 99-like domain-containing protein [Candidatus Sumerlaeia bacterium]